MRFEALRSFKALVETGSYTGAAAALFLSPTTVHGHIRAIEEEMGATLVTFSNRRLELTQAGGQFLLFAERSLTDWSGIQDNIRGLAHPAAERLNVVSLHGPSVHLLPPAVRAFQEQAPGTRVVIEARGVGESFAALLSGQVDLAVTNDLHTDMATGQYAATVLYEDELVLVVRRDEPERDPLALLARYPIATQAPTSGYRQYLERWAREQGLQLRIQYEHGAFDGICAYVLAGGCVGMVAGYVARTGPLRGQLRELALPGFALHRRVIAIHPVHPRPVAAAFIQFCQRFYAASGSRQPAGEPHLLR